MYLEQLRFGLPKALADNWILILGEVVRCDPKVFNSMHAGDQLLHSIPSHSLPVFPIPALQSGSKPCSFVIFAWKPLGIERKLLFLTELACSDTPQVHDWHCQRDGVLELKKFHTQGPCSSELHVSDSWVFREKKDQSRWGRDEKPFAWQKCKGSCLRMLILALSDNRHRGVMVIVVGCLVVMLGAGSNS